MKVKTLEELVNEGALEGKRVFIRADMNVPPRCRRQRY